MTPFITRDAQHIIMPWREDLATLIPHGRSFDFQGARMLLVPNQTDEARVCRNLGVPVPPPIISQYDWCGQKPWESQKITAAMMVENTRAYVLNTMGTGKTRSALWAIDFLMRARRIKRVLITAPLSTLTTVWESEAFRIIPHRKLVVLYGDRKKRHELLKRDAEIYVINHHGLVVLGNVLKARGFDAFLIDELAVFRNKQAQLWKAAATVVAAPSIKYVWGMTGSPTPNDPVDAWAQVHMLTPENTTRSKGQFQDQTMRRVTDFRWVPRPEANDIVHRAMQPAVRFTRDDVMELPETSYVDRMVPLDPKTAKAYKMLFDKAQMTTDAGKQITAVNEGVVQNKLLQIACGYVYTNDQTVYALPNSARFDALEELVTEADRKVIVFVPYLHALDGVKNYLHNKGHSVAVINGGTSRKTRDNTFRAFQEEAEPRIIAAHPQTMAHGLTLTAANTIIWFEPTTSLEIYEQANARITRPGQTAKTLIAHLFSTPVEKLTYARLRSKSKMQGVLLEMFKRQPLEF